MYKVFNCKTSDSEKIEVNKFEISGECFIKVNTKKGVLLSKEDTLELIKLLEKGVN